MPRTELKTGKGLITIGTKIRINHLNNGCSPIKDEDYNGREGTVTSFDDVSDNFHPGMHGTWGGLAVYDIDDFDIIP